MTKLTIDDIKKLKNIRPITMLTCYDATTASILEKCNIDILLVGDSCANVFLGEKKTRAITVDDLAYHVKAVRNGAPNTHILADLDYKSSQSSFKAVKAAKKLIKAGADSIKIEGYNHRILKTLKKSNIPVCGHVGLLPQTAKSFRVIGKDNLESQKVLGEAQNIAECGIFLLVVECVPSLLGEKLTKKISVPVIGIGAGVNTDGQVLVINDLLGVTPKTAKFVRKYLHLNEEIEKGVNQYIRDVKLREFPSEKEIYQ